METHTLLKSFCFAIFKPLGDIQIVAHFFHSAPNLSKSYFFQYCTTASVGPLFCDKASSRMQRVLSCSWATLSCQIGPLLQNASVFLFVHIKRDFLIFCSTVGERWLFWAIPGGWGYFRALGLGDHGDDRRGRRVRATPEDRVWSGQQRPEDWAGAEGRWKPGG